MFDIMTIDQVREEGRVWQQMQRAKDEGLPATLTLDEWLSIIALFEGLCAYCRTSPFESLDHLIPILSGGGTTKENCVPACISCNSKKGCCIGDDISDAQTLLEAVSRIQGSLRPNFRKRQYRGPYADKGELIIGQVRFPFDVLEEMKRLAQKHERSLNGEIIWALRQYIAQQKEGGKGSIGNPC